MVRMIDWAHTVTLVWLICIKDLCQTFYNIFRDFFFYVIRFNYYKGTWYCTHSTTWHETIHTSVRFWNIHYITASALCGSRCCIKQIMRPILFRIERGFSPYTLYSGSGSTFIEVIHLPRIFLKQIIYLINLAQ